MCIGDVVHGLSFTSAAVSTSCWSVLRVIVASTTHSLQLQAGHGKIPPLQRSSQLYGCFDLQPQPGGASRHANSYASRMRE
jgi:hypothetical protein